MPLRTGAARVAFKARGALAQTLLPTGVAGEGCGFAVGATGNYAITRPACGKVDEALGASLAQGPLKPVSAPITRFAAPARIAFTDAASPAHIGGHGGSTVVAVRCDVAHLT